MILLFLLAVILLGSGIFAAPTSTAVSSCYFALSCSACCSLRLTSCRCTFNSAWVIVFNLLFSCPIKVPRTLCCFPLTRCLYWLVVSDCSDQSVPRRRVDTLLWTEIGATLLAMDMSGNESVRSDETDLLRCRLLLWLWRWLLLLWRLLLRWIFFLREDLRYEDLRGDGCCCCM